MGIFTIELSSPYDDGPGANIIESEIKIPARNMIAYTAASMNSTDPTKRLPNDLPVIFCFSLVHFVLYSVTLTCLGIENSLLSNPSAVVVPLLEVLDQLCTNLVAVLSVLYKYP